MTDLMKFYEDFISCPLFAGVHKIEDEHTLHLCKGYVIVGAALDYVVRHCPSSCRYFVSMYTDDSGLACVYLCVYDD